MDNKLGLNISELNAVEYQIVKTKLKVIDEYMDFNSNNLFDYLKKLNLFLFEDLYMFNDSNMRVISEKELSRIEEIMFLIRLSALENNLSSLKNLLLELYDHQIFQIGNKRTIIGFLKVLNNSYELGLNVDLSKDFSNIYDFFNGIFKSKVK